MPRLPFVVFILAGLIAAGILLWPVKKPVTNTVTTNTVANQNAALPTNESSIAPPLNVNAMTQESSNSNTATDTSKSESSVVMPVADFFSRITKKPFGIYITPAISPVQPEKFTGYHTGADAETTAAEVTVDVPIYAIAAGTVVFAGRVTGYGGVMFIRHVVGAETVTALYGHLRIGSFTVSKGNTVKKGERIGVLGIGYSSETDGERKHLHFGVIKGTAIIYRGYVRSKSELSSWRDPAVWLRDHGADS